MLLVVPSKMEWLLSFWDHPVYLVDLSGAISLADLSPFLKDGNIITDQEIPETWRKFPCKISRTEDSTEFQYEPLVVQIPNGVSLDYGTLAIARFWAIQTQVSNNSRLQHKLLVNPFSLDEGFLMAIVIVRESKNSG